MGSIRSLKRVILFEGGRVAYTRHDHATALRQWHSSADQGLAAAQFALGFIYADGRCIPQDCGVAINWYSKAAVQGYAPAQYNLGVMYARGRGAEQNYSEAAAWYRKAAEQGHAAAQYNLGAMYEAGQGVQQDDVQAITWYRRAVGQGLFGAMAQLNLGFMYSTGRGVAQNYAEAKKWTRKASQQWLSKAMIFMVAIDLDSDRWREQWPKHDAHHELVFNQPYYSTRLAFSGMILIKVLEWQSSRKRSAMFYEGKTAFDRGDYVAARQMWHPLADQGFAPAQAALGQMLFNGRGIERDYAEAISWFRKAADQQFSQAQALLGVAYHCGRGVPQDYPEFASWFRKAAEQGHALAQSILGRSCEMGNGVPRDYVQAHKWLSLAATRFPTSDHESRDDAAKRRDSIAATMTSAQLAAAKRLAREWKPRLRYRP